MINKMQVALIKKDLRGITANKQLFYTILIVPLILTVVIPSIFILIVHFMPEETSDFQRMLDILPIEQQTGDLEQMVLRLVLNSIMPIFFLIIPIMAASVMAASSFVGEKEKRTLETLLYCPLSLKQIFQSKILASFLMSMMVSFASFFAMVIVVEIEIFFTTGNIMIPDISWLAIMLLVAPAMSLIAITLIVRSSAKAQTMEESQQRAVFLVLPVILLVAGQFTGILLVSFWVLFGLGIVLLFIALLLMRGSIGKFSYETLLR